MANLFFENSTRTRLSFELAEKRLECRCGEFLGGFIQRKKGRDLADTVRNILAMKVDMVVMRHPHPGGPLFGHKIGVPIINAGDGTHEHPTQALLDCFTLTERLGSLTGKKVCILGDIRHSRVALSNVRCLALIGAEVMVCGPAT